MPDSRVNSRQRRAVVARAGGCCEYCRTPSRYSPDPFATEHIVPRSLGGRTRLDNLALARLGCNGYKYNRVEFVDSSSEQSVPLFHPRKDRWSAHFVWDETCTLMIGLTATGRATIEALRLNRPKLVNLRRILLCGRRTPS